MPERSDEQLLLTYAELGARLGISPDGARMRAKREHWRHERNDPSGPVRVRVPAAVLPEHPPERSGERSTEERTNDAAFRANVVERLDELAAHATRAAEAEAGLRAELGRAREEASGYRAALARVEAKAEAVVTVAKGEIEAAKRIAAAEVAARDAVIEELRAELARLRLPWWRRWIGG